MDVTINYFLYHRFHQLQILYLWPALLQASIYLINCIFHWSILGTIWWTTNNMMPVLPHGLVHLWCLMWGKIVVYQSPTKSWICNRIVRVEHMLNKHTICHWGCARLCGNTRPNTGVAHRAYNTRQNCRISSFHGQYDCQFKRASVTVPQLPNLHPPGRWAVFPVGWIEMQPKLICIYQKPPRYPANPKRPRLIPIETTSIYSALGKCMIGNGRCYLHGIAQFTQSWHHQTHLQWMQYTHNRLTEAKSAWKSQAIGGIALIDRTLLYCQSCGMESGVLPNAECSSTSSRGQGILPDMPLPSIYGMEYHILLNRQYSGVGGVVYP